MDSSAKAVNEFQSSCLTTKEDTDRRDSFYQRKKTIKVCLGIVIWILVCVPSNIMAILFYYVFEPALINAFSKSGRFITKEESSSMALFMNATFIIVSFSGYFAFIRSVLNKRAEK